MLLAHFYNDNLDYCPKVSLALAYEENIQLGRRNRDSPLKAPRKARRRVRKALRKCRKARKSSLQLMGIYIIADKYNAPALRSRAAQQLWMQCHPVDNAHGFVGALRIVNECMPDDRIWKMLMPRIRKNIKMLLRNDAFKEWLLDEPDTNMQLLRSFLKPPDATHIGELLRSKIFTEWLSHHPALSYDLLQSVVEAMSSQEKLINKLRQTSIGGWYNQLFSEQSPFQRLMESTQFQKLLLEQPDLGFQLLANNKPSVPMCSSQPEIIIRVPQLPYGGRSSSLLVDRLRSHEILTLFSRRLEQARSTASLEQMRQRLSCARCGQPPLDLYVAGSCCHVYCMSCIEKLPKTMETVDDASHDEFLRMYAVAQRFSTVGLHDRKCGHTMREFAPCELEIAPFIACNVGTNGVSSPRSAEIDSVADSDTNEYDCDMYDEW